MVAAVAAFEGCATTTMRPEGTLLANVAQPVLLPAPRMIALAETRSALRKDAEIAVRGVRASAAGRLAGHIAEALDALGRARFGGRKRKHAADVLFRIDAKAMPHGQGYVLDIGGEGICAVARDEAGLFYAAMTLKQLARQYAGAGALPCVHIKDWPDFPNRGVMLDVARCKVPEMSTLYALVDMLSEWKFNQLQLYTEHTFAYKGHHTVWEDASPMTPAQIRALDAYCKARYIELVPNQNSFGHLGRWLALPAYKHLSEMPGGSGELCAVDPASVEFLRGLYADLLPNFSSGQVNVGCDETWTLGKGRSKEAAERLGLGRVYLDFLLDIYKIVQSHGRRMQFWGDIIMHYPELIPELPKNVIAMAWGYEAAHPFAEHGKRFAASGVPFYVVPGTSSWNSLVGRTDNAVGNLRNAAENGLANGAIGYLITDWGDCGHWQFQPVSYLGFAYGAGVSWAYEANKDMDIPKALDVYAFEDEANVMGRLVYDLGNVHKKTGVIIGNSSVYYPLLLTVLEGNIKDSYALRDLDKNGLEDTIASVDRIMANLPRAKMRCPDAALIVKEFEFSAALIRLACKLGLARLEAGGVGTSQVPAAVRHTLAAELEPLIPEFRQLWLERNRCGGLKESAGHFERLLATLEAE